MANQLPPVPDLDAIAQIPLPDDDLDELVTTDVHHSNAGVVHVGKVPPNIPSDWVITTVYFHGFADLPHESESAVKSSNFHCLGHQWFLQLYPRGMEEIPVKEMVSLFLCHTGGGTIEIEWGFNVRYFGNCEDIDERCFCGDKACGWPKFLKRDTALTYLVKGALVIEVWMKEVSNDRIFVPSNPSSFKCLFMEQKSADVVFEIGGEGFTSGNDPSTKKQETSKTTFYAHRCILMFAAPLLADMCMASTDNKSPTVIEFPKESVPAFQALLRYIYGFNIYNVGKDVALIKDILEVADKFGVVNLKLEAEDLLISSISLDVDNVIDFYLYAHDNNCALLKESVMDFVTDNWDDFHASNKVANVLDGLRGSFENDMMTAMKIKSRADAKALGTLRISELRRKANVKGLDIDGSRETLISLLN